MKKAILGMIFAVAVLQAQVGGGFGVGNGIGRGGGAAGASIEQFQQAGTMAAAAGGRGLTVLNSNSRATVVGRPVSGTEEQRSTQTLGDGTEIATSQSDQFYRDSAGRTRVEMTEQGRISIFDPVARVSVTLNAATKTARKVPLPAITEELRKRAALTAAQSATYTLKIGDGALMATVTTDGEAAGGRVVRDGAENMQHEELGVQSLNGVLATGTRNTMTIPQGAIGNNRDIHVVNERWYSDDLQMLVKTVNSDPRFGENTYEFTNISRDEPDASLFQIPPDYTILEVGAGRGVELKTLPAINK
jgi:hypothetical protein